MLISCMNCFLLLVVLLFPVNPKKLNVVLSHMSKEINFQFVIMFSIYLEEDRVMILYQNSPKLLTEAIERG